MKLSVRILALTLLCWTRLWPAAGIALAAGGDLGLHADQVTFSTSTILEGRSVRMYATVSNTSTKDLRGIVRFLKDSDEIQGDQPISALAGKEDSVFVDWNPTPGNHTIKVVLVPFEKEGDDPSNNLVQKEVTVLPDSDRDGISNGQDEDDDNDGATDQQDAFPLDRNEQLDSDGDQIGNNKDDDDDNDGFRDAEDALPLDANEHADTDKDSIGNNADPDDDNDGLSDPEEAKKGTDPLKVDTDGDGVNDKEDGWPLDPGKARDFDRDGTTDSQDTDADNDGIVKGEDVNDTNVGPVVVITTESLPAPSVMLPNQTAVLESSKSHDADGKVVKTEWTINGKKQPGSGEKLKIDFTAPGRYQVAATVTDDKGESRTQVQNIYVVAPWILWAGISLLFILIILAIFLLFSYSTRRVSGWESFQKNIDLLKKLL